MEKGKGLIVVLILIIVMLLTGLIFGYKEYSSLSKKYEKITNEGKKQEYSSFVNKIKESRKELSKTLDYDFNETSNFGSDSEKEYRILLDKNGKLSYTIGTSDKENFIAKNVLFYRLCHLGNGGFKKLFYVTEEGYVYEVNIDEIVNSESNMIISKQMQAKNIVMIMPGSGGSLVDSSDPGVIYPFFIDINGKIYRYEYIENE